MCPEQTLFSHSFPISLSLSMSKEVRIALLAIFSIAILLLGYKFIIGKSVLAKKQYFKVKYKNIDQLQVSNPVMINGFEVGAVSKIFLDPADNVTPIVEIEIRKDIKIPKDAKAILASVGLMGGKAVEIKFNGICTDCAKSGDYLEAGVKSMLDNFVGEGQIEGYTDKLKSSALSIFDTLTGESGKKEIKESIQNFEKTLQNLANSTTTLNNLLARNTTKIDKLLTNLESVVSNIQGSNKEIHSIIKNLDTVSTQIKEGDVSKSISEFNATMKETKGAISELKGTLTTAEKTMNSVTSLIKKAESGDGSASRILNDPALYQNLNATSKQLSLLLQDLRLNPKRYVNVSVFGKKQKEYVEPKDDPATDTIEIEKRNK